MSDTAEAYGFSASEKSLAKALRPAPQGSRYHNQVRHRLIPMFPTIATAPASASSSRSDKSLKALNTDYVDIYLYPLARSGNAVRRAVSQALDELVKQGKVRAVGLSNFKLSEIERCARTRRVDVVQYCWNMSDRRMHKEIFPVLRREKWHRRDGLASLAYGVLTGTLNEESAFEKGDWRARSGKLGNINLFQHLFGPDHFLNNLRAVDI